ncbi:hypothetical protein [Streptosporangium sp. NPDC000396]|uniref:hypothetical protein n=1 Tax=Streptosporangium sp. NPDC000396 TaxID=3366185 RepID=UPI00367F1020
MTDSHEEFGWLAKHGPFYHVSCITFARSLSPREALMRLGADSNGIEEVTFEKHQERTMEYIDSDNMRTSYAGALEMNGWTVLIHAFLRITHIRDLVGQGACRRHPWAGRIMEAESWARSNRGA